MGSHSAYVVSDLHLGSAFCHHEHFLAFLDGLPEGARLILNGDIVDEPRKPLSKEHRQVLERLREESFRRPLVWVYGNHDAEFRMQDPGRICFADKYELDRLLLITHGDDMDQVMPRHGFFKWLFRRFHRLRVRLGFRNVHVAEYAKRWSFLYRVLSEHVARNALRAARELGFAAVTCGHTHAPMDIERDGHRYLNTGSWTEKPLHYLQVEGEELRLQVFENGALP